MKIVIGSIFSVVSIVVISIFWIQSVGDNKFYPKIAGENLAYQLNKIEQRTQMISDQNIEIIRAISRIEARQDSKKEE